MILILIYLLSITLNNFQKILAVASCSLRSYQQIKIQNSKSRISNIIVCQ